MIDDACPVPNECRVSGHLRIVPPHTNSNQFLLYTFGLRLFYKFSKNETERKNDYLSAN